MIIGVILGKYPYLIIRFLVNRINNQSYMNRPFDNILVENDDRGRPSDLVPPEYDQVSNQQKAVPKTAEESLSFISNIKSSIHGSSIKKKNRPQNKRVDYLDDKGSTKRNLNRTTYMPSFQLCCHNNQEMKPKE